MKNIYGKANRYKTKAQRYRALSLYQKRLLWFLNEGFNPYMGNTEFLQDKLNTIQNTIQNTTPKEVIPVKVEPKVEKPLKPRAPREKKSYP